MKGADTMGDYETPVADVWSNSVEPGSLDPSGIGGGGIPLPDIELP